MTISSCCPARSAAIGATAAIGAIAAGIVAAGFALLRKPRVRTDPPAGVGVGTATFGCGFIAGGAIAVTVAVTVSSMVIDIMTVAVTTFWTVTLLDRVTVTTLVTAGAGVAPFLPLAPRRPPRRSSTLPGSRRRRYFGGDEATDCWSGGGAFPARSRVTFW